MGKNYYIFLRAHKQSTTTLVFKVASIFQTPLRQNCLPHSIARRPPSRTAEPLCTLWMILPLCTTSLQLRPPLRPFCTFPPLLMRINGWWSCASVWTCVRWLLNTVLTRLVSRTSQTMLQSTGAKHSTMLSHNYSADNPA